MIVLQSHFDRVVCTKSAKNKKFLSFYSTLTSLRGRGLQSP